MNWVHWVVELDLVYWIDWVGNWVKWVGKVWVGFGELGFGSGEIRKIRDEERKGLRIRDDKGDGGLRI